MCKLHIVCLAGMPSVELLENVIEESTKIRGFSCGQREEDLYKHSVPEQLIQKFHSPETRYTKFMHKLEHAGRELSILRRLANAWEKAILE